MEKTNKLELEDVIDKRIKEKDNIIVHFFKKHSEKKRKNKEKLDAMTKKQRVRFYTKDLFINSCMAFVYDFVLRVVVSALFFKGHWPTSILGYFFEYLFVKYGFYYQIIWVVSFIAAITYFVKKTKNLQVFYISWIAVAIICLFQILIDFHVYVDFLKLIVTFNFVKIFNLFRYDSFQIELFVLFWSITNLTRFWFVSKSMTKIKISISEIKD